MKISFFLTPKASVAWVSAEATMRQAIEKMEVHQHTAVPILNRDGTYAGTLTEGDILYYMKQHPFVRFDDTETVPLAAVSRRRQIDPVHVDAEIEELLARAVNQNFVPVVDDRDVFIGIVRRSAILSYFLERFDRPRP